MLGKEKQIEEDMPFDVGFGNLFFTGVRTAVINSFTPEEQQLFEALVQENSSQIAGATDSSQAVEA